ncbi:MAG TPA: PQQ-dependent sugar dehydrogenase [Phycisphaerae bacterium]|nr:PQQ-dependent sugar dehydrogenase [Phycisphaerae bacterium]HRW51476.1 PQQ-dependent sugar dehydrogenase [Phycisphaerae bacterium]
MDAPLLMRRLGGYIRSIHPRKKIAAAAMSLLFVASCGYEVGAFLNLFVVGRADDPGPYMSEVPTELDVYVPNARFPVGMAFLPDGSLLYTEKDTGQLRIVSADGVLWPFPVADVPVANLGDSGLLGLTLDPDFANNRYVYLGFTTNDIPTDNALPRNEFRVQRCTLTEDYHGVVFGSDMIVANLAASGLPGHEGGALVFGPDGRLYVSLGDRRLNTFANEESQDPSVLAGKIVRMNSDGTVPSDNPYGADLLAWAIGLRNTFDFAFDPMSGLMYGPENGAGPDELNLIEAGRNYGWPLVQGAANTEEEMQFAAATPEYTEPLIGINVAPTGVGFNPTDVFGADLRNQLFVTYFETGTIDRFVLSDDRRNVLDKVEFVAGIPNGPNDLVFGPDGCIYISTEFNIYRIRPTSE